MFEDSLKKNFYGNGENKLTSTSRICLLNAAGTPIGSDTIERVSAMIYSKDDLVDMGLPSGTLWGKKNLGALTENDYGWYFSWGNLDGHQEGSGYNFSQETYDATSAASISANLTLAQDAARQNLGVAWKMPTKEQFEELFNNEYTTNTWVTNYNGVTGLNGRLVTSKANGNTVFFPAVGYYDGTSLYYRGSYGYYWSSSYLSATYAYYLYFNSSSVNPADSLNRRLGFTARAVV